VGRLEDESGEEISDKMIGDIEVPVYTMADKLVNLDGMAVPVSIGIDDLGTSP